MGKVGTRIELKKAVDTLQTTMNKADKSEKRSVLKDKSTSKRKQYVSKSSKGRETSKPLNIDKAPDYKMKIVLCGDSSVGKSALIKRYVKDKFDYFTLATTGMEIKFKKQPLSDNKLALLQIW